MNYLITKDVFFKIFKNPQYRLKLDKIILNFWGLETTKPLCINLDTQKDVVLEFNVLLENNFLFNIKVQDTKKLFQSSKSFYLNFSLKEKNQAYELILPTYWNVYCQYQSKNKLQEKVLLKFAKIFTVKNIKELKKVLNNLKDFNNKEINDIINIVNMQK